MDNRKKIKTRREERSKKKKEMKGGETLFKRKDNVVRRNDIIVSPFANKIKFEPGENSNPVKQEGEEDVRGEEEGEEVVTVEEKVDLEEEPCVELEGSLETGHAAEVPSAVPIVPEAGPSGQPLGISSDPTATPMPLQETVNYLVGVVESMSAEMKEVKLKLSKVSTETPNQQPSTSAATSSQEDPCDMETSQDEDSPLEVTTDSRLASDDGTGSRHCLVCYKDVPSSSDDVHDDSPLIDKQLEGIFVLNKLLGISPASLGKYLELCPDANPASWINLCSECMELVQSAWRVQDEIVNASKKLKRIQEQVIQKIKLSMIGPQNSTGPQVVSSNIAEVVTRESRKFVREHDYGHFRDPFPQGDQKACQLLTKAKPRSETEASSKSKETQSIDNEVVAPEVDHLMGRIRMTKSRNKIGRKRKSRQRLIDEKGAFFREDGKISFRCQIPGCCKVYTSVQNYRAHKLLHSGERPKYSCDLCDKVLRSGTGLYLHKKAIHEKNFKYREYYKNHHTQQVQVQIKCPHCDYITDKYNLAAHIKHVHEKVCAVTCELCGRRYNWRSTLVRHQIASHGICPVEGCRQEFPGDRRGFRNHQLEAHGREINVFECGDCGKLVTRTSYLRIHQRKVHGAQKGRKNTKGAA